MKSKKTASESLSIQTKMVLPHDTNPLNTLFGGSIFYYMLYGGNQRLEQFLKQLNK